MTIDRTIGGCLGQLILSVDDFPPQRYVRAAILRAAGFEVIEAATGREALALARDRHPQVVVLDVHLPDIDGLAVCRQLKDDPRTAGVLVLHVSSTFREPNARVLALDNGADGYLMEPVEPDELVAHVRSLLRLAKAESDARQARRALEDSLDQRERAEEALREANAQLREADRRKDEFIAVLSHELRNPLAPVRFALPLLSAQPLNEAGVRALTVIERQVDHLTRLVDDLLTASRIASGKFDLRLQRVTLQSVVSAGIEGTSPALMSRHTVKVVMPDEPTWVRADSARLAQAVTNLLDNSAKYTPPDGEIVLEAGRDGDRAVICVRDSGIGIAAEALPRVFDMFWQVASPEQAQGGVGIGLALVKRLVEMHGGRVEARSAGIGRGAEFVIELPVLPAAAEDAAATRSSEVATHPLKVLVVDDNQDLLEMLSVVVEAGGHDVCRAEDGAGALAACAVFRPDVVLLDVGLPDMSGLAVARALRQDPLMAGVRLIALTGWGQVEDRREAAAAGFDHHLTKPADPDSLLQLLATLGASV